MRAAGWTRGGPESDFQRLCDDECFLAPGVKIAFFVESVSRTFVCNGSCVEIQTSGNFENRFSHRKDAQTKFLLKCCLRTPGSSFLIFGKLWQSLSLFSLLWRQVKNY